MNNFSLLLPNGYKGSLAISGTCGKSTIIPIIEELNNYTVVGAFNTKVLLPLFEVCNIHGSIGSTSSGLSVIIRIDKKELHRLYSVFHVAKLIAEATRHYEVVETKEEYILSKIVL